MILPEEPVLTWLRHGVPLTLLADLLDPAGPRSREILVVEALADDVARANLLAKHCHDDVQAAAEQAIGFDLPGTAC